MARWLFHLATWKLDVDVGQLLAEQRVLVEAEVAQHLDEPADVADAAHAAAAAAGADRRPLVHQRGEGDGPALR